MRHLSAEEFESEALQSLKKVFKSLDATGQAFNREIEKRSLIYAFCFRLEKYQILALARAAEAIGDNGCFISITEKCDDYLLDNFNERNSDKFSDHYYISTTSISDYFKLGLESEVFLFENSIYSPSGSWGLSLSDLDFAIVGGSDKFVSTFLEELPTTEERNIEEVIRSWKIDSKPWFDTDGPRRVLTYVFGNDKARELLKIAGHNL